MGSQAIQGKLWGQHPGLWLFITMIILFTGCNVGGTIKNILGQGGDMINQVSQDLDQAISSLNSQSANWQDVLKNLITKLPKDVSNEIRGDLTNLLNGTIAAAGSEARCDADFFRIRVQQELQQIENKLLGKPPLPLEPHSCTIVPSSIDMNLDPASRNKINFYGYDFDKTKMHAFLISNFNQQTDISDLLTQSTDYQMILNLGGNGVQLDNEAQDIVLKWNDEEISTVPVIQPTTEICDTSTDNPKPTISPYIPPKIGSGDADFDGHGPYVSCRVSLINYGDRITAKIFMDAVEQENNGKHGDGTEAQGEEEVLLYNVDPGKTIERIISPSSTNFGQILNGQNSQQFPGSGPVATYTFIGDTKGNDAGIKTGVTIVFNAIRIQLKDKGNCISSETVKSLIRENKISPALKLKMQSLLKKKL